MFICCFTIKYTDLIKMLKAYETEQKKIEKEEKLLKCL